MIYSPSFCGRGRIRTHDTVTRMTDFKSVAVQPLGYSSICLIYIKILYLWYENNNNYNFFGFVRELFFTNNGLTLYSETEIPASNLLQLQSIRFLHWRIFHNKFSATIHLHHTNFNNQPSRNKFEFQ